MYFHRLKNIMNLPFSSLIQSTVIKRITIYCDDHRLETLLLAYVFCRKQPMTLLALLSCSSSFAPVGAPPGDTNFGITLISFRAYWERKKSQGKERNAPLNKVKYGTAFVCKGVKCKPMLRKDKKGDRPGPVVNTRNPPAASKSTVFA